MNSSYKVSVIFILQANSSWTKCVFVILQMVATYTCKKPKTACWPMVLFFNMLNVSALNSYVLWSDICPKWHSGKSFKRRLFLEELLGTALVAPLMENRQHLPRTPASLCVLKQAKRSLEVDNEASTSHTEATPRKRMRCYHCSREQDQKNTVMCRTCINPVTSSQAVYHAYCLQCTDS